MKPTELAKKCVESINRANATGTTPTLMLGLHHQKSNHRHPFGRGGPVGEVVQWNIPQGSDIVRFDPLDVLAYLVAQGVVKVAHASSENSEYVLIEGEQGAGDAA